MPERMKIEKIQILAAKLHDKRGIRYTHEKFKKPINHGLVLKKVHTVIKFNQEAWLKPYIDMKTELRKNVKKMILESIFFK